MLTLCGSDIKKQTAMLHMSELGKTIRNSKETLHYACNFLKRIRVFDTWKHDKWEKLQSVHTIISLCLCCMKVLLTKLL